MLKEKKNQLNPVPLVTISILCYNNLKYTIPCIESVLSETKLPFELLITDNKSSDDTLNYLGSLHDRRVKVYHNENNKGFITAHNEALEKANGKYFLVLNNDLTVKGDWIEKIIPGFDPPGVKIVGPVGCRLGTNGIGYEVFNGNIDYIEGCCLAMETDFARRIGLFSNEYEFMYCEDSDLGLRVRAMGYKIKRVDCQVKHLRGVTANGKVDVDIRGYWFKNHYTLKKKWAGYLATGSFERQVFLKRTGAVGDVFLLTPIIAHLKQKNIYIKINIVTRCPQLLEENPMIEKIWTIPPPGVEVTNLDGAYERHPLMHIVDAYARELGIQEGINRQPIFHIANDDMKWAKTRCPGEYIVLHAGPTHWPGRQIPITTLIEVVTRLKKLGYKTVEIGNVKNLANVDESLMGINWKQSAAIIKNSAAFVGIDSAPMHIAQAFNKPGVAVFGCINPRYRLANPEILRPVTVEVGCKFCHHWQSAPRTFSDCLRKDPRCMNAITPDQVIMELERAILLNKKKFNLKN